MGLVRSCITSLFLMVSNECQPTKDGDNVRKDVHEMLLIRRITEYKRVFGKIRALQQFPGIFIEFLSINHVQYCNLGNSNF